MMVQLTFHRTKHDIDTIIKNTRGKLYRARCTKATTRVLILDGEKVLIVHCTARRTVGSMRVGFHVDGRAMAAANVAKLIAAHNEAVDRHKRLISGVNPHPVKNNPDCDDVWFGDVNG